MTGKAQAETASTKLRRLSTSSLLGAILLISPVAAQAQLSVNDGDFEFDPVSMMGTYSPAGYYLNNGSFWRSSSGSPSNGISAPSTAPASPLSGQVGQFVGGSFIFQHIGFLEADTTYTISFDFQTTIPSQFYARLAFADEYGNPETALDTFGNWYIVPIGGSDITSASYQNNPVTSGPVPMSSVIGNYGLHGGYSSPYVGSGELSFTTSADPSTRLSAADPTLG